MVEPVETTGVPHLPQNFLPGVNAAPHFGHTGPEDSTLPVLRPGSVPAGAPNGLPH